MLWCVQSAGGKVQLQDVTGEVLSAEQRAQLERRDADEEAKLARGARLQPVCTPRGGQAPPAWRHSAGQRTDALGASALSCAPVLVRACRRAGELSPLLSKPLQKKTYPKDHVRRGAWWSSC